MLKRLLVALILAGSVCVPVQANTLAKTDIYIAIDYSLTQYDHVTINTISLGRTNRQTVAAGEAGAYYRRYSFMNFVYTDTVLVSAAWYARGEQANPVNITQMVLTPEMIRERSRNEVINLFFYPDRIEIH